MDPCAAARSTGTTSGLTWSPTSSLPQTPVKINQDANIFATELEQGKSLTLSVGAGRQAYFLCIDGGVQVKSAAKALDSLHKHDAAEVVGPIDLEVSAQPGKGGHLLYVEMKGQGEDTRF
jgi:redox-sensitive bicupin YhaK (pirin superfamily)